MQMGVDSDTQFWDKYKYYPEYTDRTVKIDWGAFSASAFQLPGAAQLVTFSDTR